MLCSTQTCSNKHNWTAQLALTDCQGCHTPVLALRMVQCPYCNEPAMTTTLRIDYIAGTHPITKKCQKELHIGPEYIELTINHEHTQWTTGGKAPAQQKITCIPVAAESPGITTDH